MGKGREEISIDGIKIAISVEVFQGVVVALSLVNRVSLVAKSTVSLEKQFVHVPPSAGSMDLLVRVTPFT